MDDRDYRIVRTMSQYGGGFVKALADCAFKADGFNLDRLKRAFPEYWSQYEEMARMVEDSAAGRSRRDD